MKRCAQSATTVGYIGTALSGGGEVVICQSTAVNDCPNTYKQQRRLDAKWDLRMHSPAASGNFDAIDWYTPVQSADRYTTGSNALFPCPGACHATDSAGGCRLRSHIQRRN